MRTTKDGLPPEGGGLNTFASKLQSVQVWQITLLHHARMWLTEALYMAYSGVSPQRVRVLITSLAIGLPLIAFLIYLIPPTSPSEITSSNPLPTPASSPISTPKPNYSFTEKVALRENLWVQIKLSQVKENCTAEPGRVPVTACLLSPLLANTARENFSEPELLELHRAAADSFLELESVDLSGFAALLIHGFAGRDS